jgi:hypothetical protein
VKKLSFAAIFLIGLMGVACDGPTAGELSVELVTPSTTDGAILFKIKTPAAMDVGEATASCAQCQAFSYRISDTELYCVVTGDLSSGPLARIAVSNVGIRGAYELTILEVSGRDRRLRSNVGYELRLGR